MAAVQAGILVNSDDSISSLSLGPWRSTRQSGALPSAWSHVVPQGSPPLTPLYCSCRSSLFLENPSVSSLPFCLHLLSSHHLLYPLQSIKLKLYILFKILMKLWVCVGVCTRVCMWQPMCEGQKITLGRRFPPPILFRKDLLVLLSTYSKLLGNSSSAGLCVYPSYQLISTQRPKDPLKTLPWLLF